MNLNQLALGLVLVTAAALLPEAAAASSQAQGVGQSLLGDISGLLSGNLGTIIGLGVSLFGLWLWMMQQNNWGIAILIFGAAVTAFPGIYGSLTQGFKNAFSSSTQSGSGGHYHEQSPSGL